MLPLMFAILLMQATQPPRKMMEWMRLALCSQKQPHFVVNTMKSIVLSVLTHTLVGAKLFIWHNTCHMC